MLEICRQVLVPVAWWCSFITCLFLIPISSSLPFKLEYTIGCSMHVILFLFLSSVCMYLEGSQPGRTYFTQHLPALLSKVSATLSAVVNDHVSQSAEHTHLSVKVRLMIWYKNFSSYTVARMNTLELTVFCSNVP